MSYLDDLNPEQRRAAEQIEGPMMIIAGAGSGKTRVLTYRIARLIEMGVDPFNILALTFTNKAAREMKGRIGKIAGPDEAKNIWMGTFHSVFMKILIAEADRIAYPKFFTVYDTDDARSVINQCIKQLGLDKEIYKPKIIQNRISALKNELITVKNYDTFPELQQYDTECKRPCLPEIYRLYTERCFKAGAMDFDDLLLKTNELLFKYPDVLAKYQDIFRFILVDEYQDTNRSQYLIVKALADRYRNICVVGDDAQSIYAFRGATIRNILNFNKDYPDAKTFKLEQNYRSSGHIVKAADSVIKKNREQLDKDIWTANEDGELIEVAATVNENEEGYFIARKIKELMEKGNGTAYNDFAVLYRTNAQSRALEDAMRRLMLPYIIYGGKSFYSRKEIKDALAYLRLAINPRDEEALLRIINYPARGIGETTIQKLIVAARHYDKSILEIIPKLDKLPQLGLNQGTKTRLENFALMMENFGITAAEKNAAEAAREIIKGSGILEQLFSSTDLDDKGRYDNILELSAAAEDFVESQRELAESSDSLADYIREIALLTDQDKKTNKNEAVITLMTIHAAKGLEFEYVFIAGMEEEIFPGGMTVSSREELEEERRLFYVAITRAKKHAILSYALQRNRFGNHTFPEPSRFIDEIDQNFVNFTGTSASPAAEEKTAKGFVRRELKPRNLKPVNASLGHSGYAIPQCLKEGDRVRHERFGAGTVLEVEGYGTEQKAIIKFDETGSKTMLLKFAKITKI